jgi:hypothetical protein
MSKISGILSGVAGEYFVAAELSRRGFIASITLKNTRGIDIIASNEAGTKTISIQVKTNQRLRKAWVLSSKGEEFHAKNLYYILVNMIGLDQLPQFYIVPSKVVAKSIRDGHALWLKTPGKKGQAHNDNNIRLFTDVNNKYLDRWDLLPL